MEDQNFKSFNCWNDDAATQASKQQSPPAQELSEASEAPINLSKMNNAADSSCSTRSFPLAYLNRKTGGGPKTADEAALLWKCQVDGQKQGEVDDEPPDGDCMLGETRAMRKSLTKHTNDKIFNAVIDGCKEHGEVHPETGLEITDKRDFQVFLKYLGKNKRDMQHLHNVTLKQFQSKSFTAESVDGWCKENDYKTSFENLEIGQKFMKQSRGVRFTFKKSEK